VKFKYEKLGIFCFVCGIMGHAENKCEVRFAMEHDNGVREWSSEIRADPRRTGGKLSSRWLREEKGGRSATEGGGTERQSIPVTGDAGVVPTGADLAQRVQNLSQNLLPNHPAIMSPVIATQTNNIIPTTKSQNAQNTFTIPGPSTFTAPFISQSSPVHQLIPADNIIFPHSMPAEKNKTAFSTIHSQIMSNQFQPITINHSNTESHTVQSFNNQILAFNSPPLLQAPHQNKPTSARATRAHKMISKRTEAKPSTDPNLTQASTDPKINKPRPEKKPKTNELKPDPTPNSILPPTIQENIVDMDAQGEKKRRRDDETTDNSEQSTESVHFVTAGPGSQACRDQ
jgi:hypothetical protein